MTIIGYIRVSTEQQDLDKQSVRDTCNFRSNRIFH
jgi:DNA invertase Pin-like site-specific DNA recombinase